ncbi:AP-1 complex subunit mu [Wickerhamomyces ciferrii]|uniref:AP-1 complex subunit mu n=1 Tax=Wickerhamomyces ciferrii (strain ATCC 14091 / BCRC 22168 / CBS 111 / JCM 3599 / NBRC 0793 / NRRL Y-1031 F-60-10) TaxID=1206466 RepID=K0KVS7_WICCF|nr:AP-1 complex subunit mu [Wickerhamomyces ciferrii]CCH46067.1 AP-1 complex subunit mu [Wickerhamomyces ciferrii]
MATIEGLTLIFEYPTSSSAPTLKTILSAIKGIGSQNIHNDSIIQISKIHTVYKLSIEKISLYALVEDISTAQSLNLKSLNQDESDEDDESDEYDEVDDDNEDKINKKSSNKDNKDKISVINPNFVFSFLGKLIEVLKDYFGTPINPMKIQANYDIMCNLMQEILEGGYPYITDLNTLKDLVPFSSSIGSKLLQTTNQIAKSYSSSTSSSQDPIANLNSKSTDNQIPWRSSNVRYTNNELFVDIIETINVILTPQQFKSRKPLNGSNINNKLNLYSNSSMPHKLIPTVANIQGRLDFTSHLSGIPDILCNLNLNGHYLGIPSLHRCVRTERWINDEGKLSFIPPDGKSTIMNYLIDLDSYTQSKTQRNIGFITPDFKTGLGLKKNEFEIDLNINFFKNVSKIENLKIEIQTGNQFSIKILRLSHGDFQTKSNGKFEWIFDPVISLGINPILRGVLEKNDDFEDESSYNQDDTDETENNNHHLPEAHFPKLIKLSYKNKGAVPSGIRVESLEIKRGLNDIKPYKGVKYITQTGEFIIR